MKNHSRSTTVQRPRLRMAAMAVSIGFALAACGGGGGADSPSDVGSDTSTGNSAVNALVAPAASLPTPTDKAAAIDFQYQRMAEFRAVLEGIAKGDEQALAALTDERYDDWNTYWEQTYPALVARLGQAADNLSESENHIQDLVYGLGPAASGSGGDEKFVPLPIVLLAVATATYIYKEEQKRNAGHSVAPTQPELDSIERSLTEHFRNSGLSDAAARARAIIETAPARTLKALQTGIEHARSFVFENGLMPAFGAIAPEEIGTLLDLNEIRTKLGEIRDNMMAIFTSKECRIVVPDQAKVLSEPGTWGDPRFEKAANTCRIYFCSTDDGDCPNLPEGDWEAAVLTRDHLRDVDLDVTANAGAVTRVDASPVAAGDIEDPAPLGTCSQVQQAGGDQPDTRTVPLGATSGTFSFSYQMYTIKDRIRVVYDGGTLFDTGCVSGSDTRLIPFSGLAGFVSVQVEPNCSGNTSGTAWNYSVGCPGN